MLGLRSRYDDGGTAGQLMRTGFPRVVPAEPLADALGEMDRAHVDALPVLDPGGEMKGIVVKGDYPARWAPAAGSRRTAGEAAHAEVPWVTPDEPIADVVEQMKAAGISTLPVVSARGHVEGVVVREDLRAATRAAAERPAERLRTWLGLAADALPYWLTAAGFAFLVVGVLGTTYGGPTWLAWVDVAVMVLALVAVPLVRSEPVAGIALVAFLTAVFAAIWLFGLATGFPAWLTWLHFAAFCGFLGLTAASVRFA